jgi:hypothetical protein
MLKRTYEIADDFKHFLAVRLPDPLQTRGRDWGKETRRRVGRVGEDGWAEERRKRSVKEKEDGKRRLCPAEKNLGPAIAKSLSTGLQITR